MKNSYWRWRYRKAGLRTWRSISSRVYRDRYPDLDRTTLVAGVARSGTTWIGDIIASQARSRIMFEPFNPRLVQPYQNFNYYQYMRPEEENEALNDYCRCIFSGHIRHRWIDRQVTHLAPQYRIVKAVRANLFLKWLQGQFPDVSQVLVIRHPCAVVLSWMQLGWATDEDIEPFLKQPELVGDFLIDKMDIIKRADTDEEKYAIIWCVGNLVPLKQFHPDEIFVMYYEHMCTQPEVEVPRLFQAVGRDYQDSIFDYLNRPSTTARPSSAVVTGHDRVTRWQKKLSTGQVNRILSIVKAFGLEYLYGDSTNPLADRKVPIGPVLTRTDP